MVGINKGLMYNHDNLHLEVSDPRFDYNIFHSVMKATQ